MIGDCAGCGRVIHFNPVRVPSIRPGGVGGKQPLCEACFNRWNQIHRISKGLEPVPLDPNAYEPEPESGL